MNRAKTIAVFAIAPTIALVFFLFWVLGTRSADQERDTKENKNAAATQKFAIEAGVKLGKTAQSATPKRPHLVSPAPPLSESSLPLEDRLVDLERQAKAGNAEMSYSLGMALRACSDMDARYERLQSDIESKAVDASVGQVRLKGLDAEGEKCKGLSIDQMRSYGQWIELAAQNGNLNAQLAYSAVVGQLLELHPLDIAWIEQYKSNSMSFLETAANSGSVDALSQLAFTYHDGIMVPEDKTEAYAYSYAASLSGLVSPALSNKLLELWSQDMTPQQVQKARVLGISIYQNCCE